MKTTLFSLSVRLLLLTSLNWVMTTFDPVRLPVALPITGGVLEVEVTEQPVAVLPPLDIFVAAIKNGQPGQRVGVYVPEVLALRLGQQPPHNPAYVTQTRGYATQFGLAARYGATALLAHNYLSGALFFNLTPGQEVDIIYGDGALRRYTISTLHHFQALRPTNPYSNFLDLDHSRPELSNAEVFRQIYSGGDRVVFQTCLQAHGNPSWGRLFVIAMPMG